MPSKSKSKSKIHKRGSAYSLTIIVKHEQYLLNNSTIIFKKNNICEIPDWSKNTSTLIDFYEQ